MLTLLIDDAIVSAEPLFAPLGKPVLCAGKRIAEQAESADALIIRSRTRIDNALLSRYPRLRFIGSSVVGLDHVDQVACQDHGVHFYSAQGCNARSVAEYVISHLVIYLNDRQPPEARTGFESITLGIVGVGQVGRRVAQMASTLGITCLLNDPFRADNEADFVHTDLDTLLAQSDVITLHTPLTRSGKYPSYHLVNHINLAQIAPNALLINAARGGIIEESALLKRDDLTLVLDCWENEPHCHPELLQRTWRATPHIAGHAVDAKYRGGQMVAQALADWMGRDHHAPDLHLDANELPSLVAPTGNTLTDPIASLAHCLTQIYDFAQDDLVLRTAMQTHKRDGFAQTFEDYRRHYPQRYEWQNFSVPQGIPTPTAGWLQRLGVTNS